jgi:hypothetical protein
MEVLVKDALDIINSASWQMFAEECDIPYPGSFQDDLICVSAPDMQLAKELYIEKRAQLAEACRKWGQSMVQISWSDNHRPLPIAAQNQSGDIISMTNPIITDPYNTPVAPELEISWDDCWNSPDAMWVVHQATQKVLYANPAAIAANGEKPAIEILNTEINVLWEDEELDNLTRLVNKLTGWLHGHSNIGYRWQRNSEDGGVIWTRKRHEFHVDYKKISYLGLECRFEHVKKALPV